MHWSISNTRPSKMIKVTGITLYKYVSKLGRCIPLGYTDCETDSDCVIKYVMYWVQNKCSSGLCVPYNSHRSSDTSTSNEGLIIGLIIVFIVFIVVAVVYKKRRERAALIVAHLNQSNQGSDMPTTQTNPNQESKL